MAPSTSPYSTANSSGAERPSPSSSADDTAAHRIVIVGGGEAGLTLLHALADHALIADVALVEPSTYEYDQPDWVRVGTEGSVQKEDTRSLEGHQVPPEVTWIKERVREIGPENQSITTDQGTSIRYEYLVVALGTKVRWDRIRNLKEHLGSRGICSVYGYEQAERTWEMIRNFAGGRALFTSPSTPHKGGSAPLALLRRADEVWREAGVRAQTELFYTTATSTEEKADLPEHMQRDEDVHVYAGYDLIEVRPERNEAVFRVTKGQSRSRDVLDYDLLHVVPPMRPPSLVEESGLGYQDGPMRGYLDVDPDSLRHPRFKRVFGVGDVIGMEGDKTGERAREQATQVAHTLRRIAGADA